MPDLRRMLYELHVSPRGMTHSLGVVVGKASPVQAVFAKVVPLFAGDFTCLAADTERRVREECSGRAHAASFIFACSSSSAALPRGRRPGRMSQISALVSMMRTFGSSLIARRSFALSPTAMPRRPQ